MAYGPGGSCGSGLTTDKKDTTCDGCFPSKSSSPIVVKICRPINPNQNRMNYGRPVPSKGPNSSGDCCQWCKNKTNVNQMVANQNHIVNFDLINRLNDAAQQSYGGNSGVTYSAGATSKRKCDNCINILRDKELQLLKKEQEILKIKTHFTKMPKSGAKDGLGTNCEHCFKALREKEFELFKKEQEIAKMKMAAAAKSPLDTQAKIDKARCSNCFKALRQKELELLKKEHALMKNMTRPNINVKNMNYCSCCRDNKKSSINKLKRDEDLRKKNRDNCFKQLRMKEIQLLQKEREIDMKIKKFREESIAKAKKDLDNTPDPRLVTPKTRDVVKCVCSCTGSPEQIEEQKKAKGLCKAIYKKFPKATGGWPSPSTQKTKSVDTIPAIKKAHDKAFKSRHPRTCSGPCCVMKLTNNFLACFLHPPKCKKPKELPEPCKFMRMLTWCNPGHTDSKKIVKCCTLMQEPEKKPTLKQQDKFEKRVMKEKVKALKEAKSETDAVSEYRVETLGRIRPGKRRPSPHAKLDAYEAEVLRESGTKGLKAYKSRMKLLHIDTEVAKTKIPKTMQFKDKDFESSEVGDQDRSSAPMVDTGLGTAVPRSKFISKNATFKTKVYDRVTREAKKYRKSAASGPLPEASEIYQTPLKYDRVTREAKKYRKSAASGPLPEASEIYQTPQKYRRKEDYERALPERYRTEVDDDEYVGSRGMFGSGDYADEWKGSSEGMRGPADRLPPLPYPKFFKILGRSVVYCAGCFIGVPCILFLCLCLLLSSCSD